MLDTRKQNKIRECIVNNEVPRLHEEAREKVRRKNYIPTQAKSRITSQGPTTWRAGAT